MMCRDNSNLLWTRKLRKEICMGKQLHPWNKQMRQNTNRIIVTFQNWFQINLTLSNRKNLLRNHLNLNQKIQNRWIKKPKSKTQITRIPDLKMVKMITKSLRLSQRRIQKMSKMKNLHMNQMRFLYQSLKKIQKLSQMKSTI